MAAVDLVSLIECAWFGLPATSDPIVEPSLSRGRAKRGSSTSLSDAAGMEQDRSADGASSSSGGALRSLHVASSRAAPSSKHHKNGLMKEDDDGVLGTWAGRQRVFAEHLREQPEQQHNGSRLRDHHSHAFAEHAPASHSRGHGASPPKAVPSILARQGIQPAETVLDQELNAAWRWRFARKWQAEQLKQFDVPTASGGGEEEEWTAALRLMDAVDCGLNMQIGRTLSLHTGSMVDASSSMEQSLTLVSPGLSQLVLLDGSAKESPLREEAAAATSQIVAMARKAQVLRRQQQEIERQVEERWEAASGGGAWVAQHLPAVQIDSWAAFSFVLVRLTEPHSQRQKLLVRGRNGASEQQAFAGAEQEVARAATAHRLPALRTELLAAGTMAWLTGGPGQRRMLRICVGRLLVPAARDIRLRSLAGASKVVAELARASFPAADFDIVAAEPSATAGSAAAPSRPSAGFAR